MIAISGFDLWQLVTPPQGGGLWRIRQVPVSQACSRGVQSSGRRALWVDVQM